MTSLSSAFIGLQTANGAPALTPDQKDVALALFKEGQSHTVSADSFAPAGCYTFNDLRTAFLLGKHCGEVNPINNIGYKPKMFPVKNFYTQVLNIQLPPPNSDYQFDQFDPGLFNHPFFNRGRQVIYGDLTQCWYASRPSLGGTPVASPLPRAEVARFKPASVTWDSPNTLTVAGYARNGSGGVQVRWRDVTTNGSQQVVGFQATPAADGSWFNTIPTSNYCHDYEVELVYSGSTSNTFLYSGIGSGYCAEGARINWIQPQWSAGTGPAGSLVVSGTAANGPAGTTVKLYWRAPSVSDEWNLLPYAATVASDGSWYNSIPNVNYSHIYEAYAKYDAFASRPARYNGNQLPNWSEVNFAASASGASASASSTYGAGFDPSTVINGDRKGVNWYSGGGWNDATRDSFPDWVQIDFNCKRTIDEINVFTLQDNYGSPSDPSETMPFTTWGITSFAVQYHNGSAWVTVPNGNVSGNNKVWRKFTFAPVETNRVRVLVNNALSSYSRITEIEALGWAAP